MGMYREGMTSFITKENFKKVLNDLGLGFSVSEVGLVADQLVEYNGKGEINWENFLS